MGKGQKKKILSVSCRDAVFFFLSAHDILALRGPCKSNLVWRGPVQYFLHEFKTTLHI